MFIYIALGITVLMVIASVVLKQFVPEKKDRYLGVIFFGLLIISIASVVFGLFEGGWNGIGYGFMGISILVGTILGRLINSIINHLIKNKSYGNKM